MKFLIDAQLPLRLSTQLANSGHDSVHTSALRDGNRTSDRELATIADSQDRVLVTKDRDFRDGYLLLNVPRQLLMVATGNITNDDLLALFEANLTLIVDAFENVPFVEINQTSVTIYNAR